MSTSPVPNFSDDDLRRYLAGEAPDELRQAIDAALEADQALVERLAALDDFGAVLAPAFDALLAKAPVADLQARLNDVGAVRGARAVDRRWAFASIAASVAAAFSVGIWAGRGPFAPPPPEQPPAPPPQPSAPARPPWLEAVAGYVRLYSAETFAAAPLSPAARARSLTALGEVTRLDLTPLAAIDGLRFQRAEVLQLSGRPLGQVAYLDSAGQPLAVCILVRPTPPEGAPRRPPELTYRNDAIGDLQIVHWDIQPYGFLVIGRQSATILRAVAEQVAAAIG